MAAPPPYGGKVENCGGFLLQWALHFETQSLRFPTDRAKIAFIISLLADKALQFQYKAEAIWQQDGNVVHDYEDFVSYFRELFTQAADSSTSREKLFKLNQGNSNINDYVLTFRTLAASCGWNVATLLTKFQQGLNPHLRLQLATHDDSMGLKQFMRTSIQVVNRLLKCTAETSVLRGAPTVLRPPEVKSAPGPMQVDQQSFFRLTPAERQRRLTQGLKGTAFTVQKRGPSA